MDKTDLLDKTVIDLVEVAFFESDNVDEFSKVISETPFANNAAMLWRILSHVYEIAECDCNTSMLPEYES